MKTIALRAGTALAALSWLGSPATAQTPGGMPGMFQPPAAVVSAPPAGVEPAGAYETLGTAPGLASVGLSNVGAGRGGDGGLRLYTEASYLLMFVSDNRSETPIATGGPSNGVLGRPGTSILLDTSTDYNTLSGFKIGVGALNGATSLGLEANVMVFGNTNDRTTVGGNTTPLARPFFDTTARRESSIVLASPGAFSGALDSSTTLSAYGGELNPFFRLVQGNSVNFDVVTGFRYFAVNEALNVYDSRAVLAGGVSAFNGIGLGNGARLVSHDFISARNQFYGGNIGGRLSYSNGGRLFVDATAKIAIGGVHQIVTVDGSTTLVSGGGLVGSTTTPGGFLANAGNSGRSSENRFAVLPEGNIQLGYQLTSWANVFAGYQVIYLSNVARAGDQVDRNINPNRLATVNTFTNRGVNSSVGGGDSSDIFLHGFNFGLTLTY